jgi:hypothetical protein
MLRPTLRTLALGALLLHVASACVGGSDETNLNPQPLPPGNPPEDDKRGSESDQSPTGSSASSGSSGGGGDNGNGMTSSGGTSGSSGAPPGPQDAGTDATLGDQ